MEFRNTFESGMVYDALTTIAPNSSYKLALNAIDQSREASGFGIVNEEANELVANFGGQIVGYSHIDERDSTLIFLYNGSSELWLFNHETEETKFITSDSEHGCTWGFDGCEFLYGEFKAFNSCSELHVYWSSDCIYHVVNIDEMLDVDRKAAVIACEDCSYFDVFKATCGPHLSALPVKNSGSTLEAGTYHFAVQFRDNDGNTTNAFDISQPVVVESEDNVAGQVGSNSIRLRMDNLDPKYDEVIIYVIRYVAGVEVVERMTSRGYSDKGMTFDYYGQQGEIVNITTITNKSKAFLRGQDLIQKDGRMFFYNLKNERNLNYQKYANQIETEWVEYEVSLEMQKKYHFPSLMRGEVYALGIVWKYNDGTYSDVFHIPGCPTSSSDSDIQGFEGEAVEFESEGTGGGGSGSTGPIAGGGAQTDPSADDGYRPYDVGSMDTSNQHERKRNPDSREDSPNEFDALENVVRDDLDSIDTTEENIKNAADCLDTFYGCDEAGPAMDNDLDDMVSPVKNVAELLAALGLDDDDPTLDQTSDLKEAFTKLIDDAVTEREYITRKRPSFQAGGQSGAGPGSSSSAGTVNPSVNILSTTFKQQGTGESNLKIKGVPPGSIRGDNWVDGLGNSITDEPIRTIASGRTEPYESVIEYPDAKDCDGNFFYPQRTVCHHRIPRTSERPHFVSYTNGVENQYQPQNDPYGQTYIRPIGLRFNNIKFPDQDDLPKPLCPNSPFKIVYVKRTNENKSIFAKGWCSGIFKGENHGSVYYFPRHGVNSFEHVDRMIAPDADDLSRFGEQSDEAAYTFHSPDTDCDQSYLPVTEVWPELSLLGNGWMYGLYAEGRRPSDPFADSRVDNRGARVANNLNHYSPAGDDDQEILGLTYAPAHTMVTAPAGVSHPLMNMFREGSVFFQTVNPLPGSDRDESFVGGVLDHFCPTKANAPYVALVRPLPDQYGSVQSLQYSELGINATLVHAQGTNAIEGVCGDVWIGPYSKRRTSYVSNKQGDFFNPPAKPGSPCRQRSWCDTGDDKIFDFLGIDTYATKLPESGDIYDPKNYAGLHTVSGACGEFGRSKNCEESAAAGVSESDFYWPRTLKSLVHCIVESHVNPWLRETGEGSQLQEGKVWYPKLKELYLDAAAPVSHPWEESFMNRFYCAVYQPSRKQMAKKALINAILKLVAPAGLLTQLQEIESIMDTLTAPITFGAISALWILAINTLFTNRKLDELLGISKPCRRDEEGGDLDECIEQFEDNYCRYNSDFSRVNDIYPHRAFPLPYNTCDCDECNKLQTNNEIYYTNKQNLDSEIDAYRNVRINDYQEIPAHYGNLQRMFIQGNNLYGHLSDGIVLMKLNPLEVPTDIASQQRGTGLLLSEPQLLFEGVAEGFAGTEHPNASIQTPFGYFFIDEKARKVYRFNGEPEEISAYGMYHFFKENLAFCGSSRCYDEKRNNGTHYSMGWDSRYNRLLLTKHDIDGLASFTVSYSPIGVPTDGGGARGKWISFHSYIPQGYIWDRNNFYSVLHGSGQIWKHHVPNLYTTYYGQSHPFMVEFSAIGDGSTSWEFQNIMLDTEAERMSSSALYPIRDLDETFNKVAVWNSTQGTGTLPITLISNDLGRRNNQFDRTVNDYSQVRFFKDGRAWTASEFKDLVDIDCEEAVLLRRSNPCQVIPDINDSIFNCEKVQSQDFRNRIFHDRNLNFRYILDNTNTLRLYVKAHKTYNNEPSAPQQQQ